MSDHNSVDLEKLKAAIDTSSKIIGASGEGLRSELSTLVTLHTEVLSRCEVQKAEQVGLTKSEALLDQWASTDSDSQVVYDEVSPDQGSTIATFNGDPIIEKLDAQQSERSDITADPGTLLGLPPTSGYADDPVCTANGNFVHQETDIEFVGFAELIDVQRTYNSLASSNPGVFGLGWSSMLDMSVTNHGDDMVRVRMADGADIPFFLDPETGQFGGQDRLGMTLSQTPGTDAASGWFLQLGSGERWTFDVEGRVSNVDGAISSAIIDWSDSGVTVTEQLSGRSARYLLDEQRRVQKVISSDGREAQFGYDDAGHCVRADRPSGAMTYTVNNDRVESITDADGVVLVTNRYDRVGRVLSQTNEHGSVSTYDYLAGGMTRVAYGAGKPANLYGHDKNGNLTSIFGGDGCAMRLWWDDANRLVRVIERSGSETRYEFDPDLPGELLVRRVDPDGLSTSYDYDSSGRVTSRTGRDDQTERYIYDGSQTVPSRVIQADGVEVSAEYNEHELPVTITDGDGVRTELLWDSDGQLVSTVSSTGARTTIVYDQAGQLARITDRSGTAISFRNDKAGRIQSMTDAGGVTSDFTYTPGSRVLTCDADGPGSWSATYTPTGVLDAFVDSVGARTSFVYDDFGRQVSHTDSNNATWSQDYDALGRIVQVTDPLGASTSCEFGLDGHVRARIEPGGARTEQTVNSMGQTTSVTNPAGQTSHWTYHPNGEIASMTDPEGLTSTYEIDVMGRLSAETAPDGNTIRYEYSSGGRLRMVTSAAGRQHRFLYDDAGRRVEVIDPDGNSEKANYQPDGRMSEFIADGATTSITYDDAGRVNGWSTVETGDSLVATLTPASAEVTVSNGSPSRFTFDLRQRLAAVSDPAGVVTEFVTNQLGQLSEVATKASRNAFTYDLAGNAVRLTDPLGVVISLRRAPSGIIESVSLDDQLVHAYTYDANDRLTDVAGGNGETLASYGYDHRDMVVKASNEHGWVEFVRDLSGRIVEFKGLDASSVTYARDADGMVTQRTDGDSTVDYVRSASGNVTGFVDSALGEVSIPSSSANQNTDAGGRVIADMQGRTYRYDPAGRLIEALSPTGERRGFTYNDYGLLATDQTPEFGHRSFTYNLAGAVEYTEADGDVSIEFGYDNVGRRVSETRSDGTSVIYVWNDLSQLVRVVRVDASNVETATDIVYSAMGRVERVDTTDIGWDDGIYAKPVAVGTDRYLRWGTRVRRCQADAEWQDGIYDDPFGLSSTGGDKVTLGFRGELTVDGLVFMGDRVYDPATRSFLSRDPLPSVPGKVAFAGVYSYAHNDPINYLDPTGRRPLSEEEFQTVREDLEKTAFERTGEFLWEHRDVFKGIIVGAVAIAAAAAFCGATAGVGCILLAGAAAGAVTMVALDGGDAWVSGDEYGWKDAGWSFVEGGVVGAASAFGGTFLARAAPIGLVGNPSTVGFGTIGRTLALNPRSLAAPLLRDSVVRSSLASGAVRTIAVDGGLTFVGKSALETVRYGQPNWSKSSFFDWIN